MWEKSKWTTKCDKRTVTCDVGIAQCEDGTVKCEKKVKERLNVTKELSHVGAEPEGGEGGHLPPLTPKIFLSM